MVFLDMPSGLRRGELAGLKWEDFDFKNLHVSVTRSLVDQHVGPVKTEASRKLMPIDEYVAHDLLEWYDLTPYKKPSDYVRIRFATASAPVPARPLNTTNEAPRSEAG
jgi:integrase